MRTVRKLSEKNNVPSAPCSAVHLARGSPFIAAYRRKLCVVCTGDVPLLRSDRQITTVIAFIGMTKIAHISCVLTIIICSFRAWKSLV